MVAQCQRRPVAPGRRAPCLPGAPRSSLGGTTIDRRRIHLDTPIKSIGTHRLTIRLHPEVEATVNVEVVPG